MAEFTPLPLNFIGVRPPDEAVHLGDGAYAQFDGHHIWLRANSHLRNECTGEVALEPGALIAFIRFAKKYWQIEEYAKCD